MRARPTLLPRSAPGPILADRREVWVAVAILAAGTGAFAAYVGPRAPAVQAVASCLVFAALFAPVAGLSVAAWVEHLTLWLSPAPGLRAGALFMAGVAVVAVQAAVFGTPSVRALGALAIVGGTVLALVGTGGVAARPLDHPLRLTLALLALWLPSEFGLVHGLPLPAGTPGGLEVGRLLLLDLGLLLLLVVAPPPHVGYTFQLHRRDLATAAISLAAFAAVAIPLGLGIGFIHWGPKPFQPLVWVQRALGIYFLTAVPEELLFRGGVQNLLEKRWRGRGARIGSLVAAALVFGAAHLNNPPAPNLRYMLLATIAGIAYGWTWQRTRCISASALTHAGVDWIWVTTFRG